MAMMRQKVLEDLQVQGVDKGQKFPTLRLDHAVIPTLI
jgi:hypothetical protein